ncbi:uncharacterized protein N0V89_006709 [Didymosphaeria variabile]|uniref:Uncharacterized protein n=1 Tax=Didymosphaeria variabile TaxID=1932322 RepID=A0A9W9C8T3_9PLEO|nr:uncharacterized protein N0V89_006709 [Didymosphaeria variabile]KAJ4351369.1 hypothetical protein N0V89_006709 [Didymosphaeria variabile]
MSAYPVIGLSNLHFIQYSQLFFSRVDAEVEKNDSHAMDFREKYNDLSQDHVGRKSDIETLEQQAAALKKTINALSIGGAVKPLKINKEAGRERSNSVVEGNSTIHNRLNATEARAAMLGAASSKQAQALEQLDKIVSLSGAILQSQDDKIKSLEQKVEEITMQFRQLHELACVSLAQQTSANQEVDALEARLLMLEVRGAEQAREFKRSEQAASRIQESLQERIYALGQSNARFKIKLQALENQKVQQDKQLPDIKDSKPVQETEQEQGEQKGLKKSRSLLRKKPSKTWNFGLVS